MCEPWSTEDDTPPRWDPQPRKRRQQAQAENDGDGAATLGNSNSGRRNRQLAGLAELKQAQAERGGGGGGSTGRQAEQFAHAAETFLTGQQQKLARTAEVRERRRQRRQLKEQRAPPAPTTPTARTRVARISACAATAALSPGSEYSVPSSLVDGDGRFPLLTLTLPSSLEQPPPLRAGARNARRVDAEADDAGKNRRRHPGAARAPPPFGSRLYGARRGDLWSRAYGCGRGCHRGSGNGGGTGSELSGGTTWGSSSIAQSGLLEPRAGEGEDGGDTSTCQSTAAAIIAHGQTPPLPLALPLPLLEVLVGTTTIAVSPIKLPTVSMLRIGGGGEFAD
jgi:hypothetical protein